MRRPQTLTGTSTALCLGSINAHSVVSADLVRPMLIVLVQTVFQGGSVADLHQLLGVVNAANVLYVGDHIYGAPARLVDSVGAEVQSRSSSRGILRAHCLRSAPASRNSSVCAAGDILRSKKSMGWRTMLIVPELQMELQHAGACEAAQRELAMLRKLRDELDERVYRLEWELVSMCAL